MQLKKQDQKSGTKRIITEEKSEEDVNQENLEDKSQLGKISALRGSADTSSMYGIG